LIDGPVGGIRSAADEHRTGPHRDFSDRRRFLDPTRDQPVRSQFGHERLHEVSMVAVIGNVIAGLLALSLFTATVRLSK